MMDKSLNQGREFIKHKINASLQIIPIGKDIDPYAVVDCVIDRIRETGIKYRVCPMETVLEGEFDEIIRIIKTAHLAALESGAAKVLATIKTDWSAYGDVSIEKKMDKYQ